MGCELMGNEWLAYIIGGLGELPINLFIRLLKAVCQYRLVMTITELFHWYSVSWNAM